MGPVRSIGICRGRFSGPGIDTLARQDESKAFASEFESFLSLGSERVNVNVNKSGYLGQDLACGCRFTTDLAQGRNDAVAWDYRDPG